VADRIPALDQKVVALEVSIGEREAQLAAIRAQAQEREAGLAAASAQAQESAAEIDRQKAEMADLLTQRAIGEARVAELEAALAERQAMQAEIVQERERSLVGVRGQVADLENVVKQVEQEAQDRVAAMKAIRSEITEMHKDLQAARRRSELAEIRAADLSEDVARARLVGRAAMQALAMSKLDTVAREPRLGWRQAMRRLFGIHR
jgi:chromosome segregation ATPase